VLDPAALRVIGAKNDPAKAEMHRRRSTHRAGLERDPKVAPHQARGTKCPRGLAHRQQLGVRAGVRACFHRIATGRQHCAVRSGHDRAHRHFAALCGKLRLLQGQFHGAFIRVQTPSNTGTKTRMSIRRKPLIGITLDSEQPGGYSVYPWYALRTNYAAAIASAGGVPVALPHHHDLASDLLDAIDGLVVTGGAFDVDPAMYGEAHAHATVTLKAGRTQAERALLDGALARDMPVLGICGGEQLLAVALGGTLIQHIPDSVPNALPHEQPNPRNEAGHAITLVEGTLLHRIVGAAEMQVNSSHHQAVQATGPAAQVNCRAPDGVIEGVEDMRRRFCLGVQWHPEFLIDPGDARIFAAFIQAATP